jgi:6-phosphogluconate dehydrogenase
VPDSIDLADLAKSDLADVGVVGLAVMGQNLALNLADNGYRVAVNNRTTAVTERFVNEHGGSSMIAASDLAGLARCLARPRRILLMVKAGPPVDETLATLLEILEPGDIVIDGGNSFWEDTERRIDRAAAAGVHLVGAGISGGEEGARHGPSIMPGGSASAWPAIREMFQAIAAKAPDGSPCCDWIGPGGSGHFVKMVHNGIEYGDMQVIAEAYDLMRASGMSTDEMADTFARFNTGRLESYLIEITSQILRRRDGDGEPLVDQVLDAAAQKGTGRWTVESALDLGQPLTLISEAVFARIVSSLKDERVGAAMVLKGPRSAKANPDRGEANEADIADALYGSKVVSYAQGFMLLRAASQERDWNLDLAAIAPLWRAGCIIRAALLDPITAAFRTDPGLANLMLDPRLAGEIADSQEGWRRTVARAVTAGIPVPAYSSALAFYDGYRSQRLPANLIQAQRDLFGAHTYERVDRPRGESFHSEW